MQTWLNKQAGWAVLLLALLGSGCAARSKPSVPYAERDRAEVKQAIAEIFAAAKAKDWVKLDSFHAYGPEFSKFGGEQPGRESSEAARAGEHTSLGAIDDLEVEAKDLKIDLFGDTAVATSVFHLEFKANGQAVARRTRATLVFHKFKEGWKIVHEHLSPDP